MFVLPLQRGLSVLCPLCRHRPGTLSWTFTKFLGAGQCCRKFEDKEDHVPKLEQINSTRILSSQNFSLTKKELLSTELLLLAAFNWNLCLPTPAHFLDYYLLASVSQKDQHCHSWPTTCARKTKECLKEYAHYFLEVTLQDHIFYKFQPSVVAAACVGASRICLQLSPYWTRDLQRISNYSLEHLSTCIEILLVAYDNVLKDAVAVKSQALAMVPGTSPAPTQMLFQPPAYPALGQPTPVALAQFQTPVQDLCLAYRDSLQAHCSGSLLSGGTSSSLHSPYPPSSLWTCAPCPCPRRSACRWPSPPSPGTASPPPTEAATSAGATHSPQAVSTDRGALETRAEEEDTDEGRSVEPGDWEAIPQSLIALDWRGGEAQGRPLEQGPENGEIPGKRPRGWELDADTSPQARAVLGIRDSFIRCRWQLHR
ncbi:hypothetical protein QTO34_016306 [Cnephaeus nilssonii]|uniref:Cyclin-J-like protein n=1 Tax=Cnephaeus nilssonii TaxID=3371016 RepID=A0AA40I5Y1_CNENI|nr:hypothetical protein QTO34_016306 [Eptesicus nilssonii]